MRSAHIERSRAPSASKFGYTLSDPARRFAPRAQAEFLAPFVRSGASKIAGNRLGTDYVVFTWPTTSTPHSHAVAELERLRDTRQDQLGA